MRTASRTAAQLSLSFCASRSRSGSTAHSPFGSTGTIFRRVLEDEDEPAIVHVGKEFAERMARRGAAKIHQLGRDQPQQVDQDRVVAIPRIENRVEQCIGRIGSSGNIIAASRLSHARWVGCAARKVAVGDLAYLEGHPATDRSLRPHVRASSMLAASMIVRPPTCSFASRKGPSVMRTSPLACGRSDFAWLGALRPPATILTPAASISSLSELIPWIVASSSVDGSKLSGRIPKVNSAA